MAIYVVHLRDLFFATVHGACAVHVLRRHIYDDLKHSVCVCVPNVSQSTPVAGGGRLEAHASIHQRVCVIANSRLTCVCRCGPVRVDVLHSHIIQHTRTRTRPSPVIRVHRGYRLYKLAAYGSGHAARGYRAAISSVSLDACVGVPVPYLCGMN